MRSRVLSLLACLLLAAPAFGATVLVYNGDGANEGFNDPTPATPIGGNPGTTIGLQRQYAFLYAANVWAAQLTSDQSIKVYARFDPLSCTANSAVLGGATPYWFLANVPPAAGYPGLDPNTWYAISLTEKLTGTDLKPQLPSFPFDMFAQFNSNLGNPGCLTGGGFYYGLNTNTPAGKTNLVTVLLHEFGHGLGFTVGPTNGSTGARASGRPSIWERYVADVSTGQTWLDMTNAERQASAINTNNLVWTGPQVTADQYAVLGGRPELDVQGPEDVRGTYEAQPAAFGPPLTESGLHDILMPAYDTGGTSATDGCEPFSTLPQKSVKGRIALVDRGTCNFTVKVKNAQNAGAVGVVIANNAPTGLPGMGGADPTIRIPSIGITQALGQALRALPELSNPGRGGLPVSLQLSTWEKAGTTDGYVRLYAPNPYASGSSVSHWDTTANPNQLMEPFINSDLTFNLTPPYDLTFSLLQDIGW